jgi:hypothetical protein
LKFGQRQLLLCRHISLREEKALMSFGKRLTLARKKKSISQEGLASQLKT